MRGEIVGALMAFQVHLAVVSHEYLLELLWSKSLFFFLNRADFPRLWRAMLLLSNLSSLWRNKAMRDVA